MIELNELIRQYPKDLQQQGFYEQMVKEYLHHLMLKALYESKQGGKIIFIGGTALRYFYNIRRFSEDLDFDCFDLTRKEFILMTDHVCKELKLQGIDVMIEDKEKHKDLKAFRRVFVFPELKYKLKLSQQREAKFFIKIEAEPHHFRYKPEIKMLNGFEIVTPVKTMPASILFASKITAAINRKKDRDFFDVIFLSTFVQPDFNNLNAKLEIKNVQQLKDALLKAGTLKKLDTRSLFDCEHMLFHKKDVEKIKHFIQYINSFDFLKFIAI